MKRLILLVLLATAGCATEAEREVGRMQSASKDGSAALAACQTRLNQSPPAQALKGKLPFYRQAPTLQMQADTSKPTPEEVRLLFTLHDDYLVPCRKLAIEAAGNMNPLFANVTADEFAQTDAVFLRLVKREISWGEAVAAEYQVVRAADARWSQASATIMAPLNQSHAAEMSRRQQASAALAAWAQNQQMIIQQQQLINAANQPRMTNCQYIGTQLSCTTF